MWQTASLLPWEIQAVQKVGLVQLLLLLLLHVRVYTLTSTPKSQIGKWQAYTIACGYPMHHNNDLQQASD